MEVDDEPANDTPESEEGAEMFQVSDVINYYISISDTVRVTQASAPPISVSEDGERTRAPPPFSAVSAVREMRLPRLRRGEPSPSRSAPEQRYAEALEILEEEMAHLTAVRVVLNQASDSLYRTILVLRNMKGNVIPIRKRSRSSRSRSNR
jgi:hypothetical protein